MKQQRESTIDEHVFNTKSLYARVSECTYFMKHPLCTLSHASSRLIAGGKVLASPRFSGLAASGLSDGNSSKLPNDLRKRITPVVTFTSSSKMSFPGMPQPGAGAGGAGMTAQQQQEQAMIKGVRHHERSGLQ